MTNEPTIYSYFDNLNGEMIQRISEKFFDCEYNPEYRHVPLVLFSLLRNKLTDEENISKGKTFLCGCCKQPIKICGNKDGSGERFHFRHVVANSECDYYNGVQYSAEQLKAMIFNGRTEGKEHRRVKSIVSGALQNEPDVENVAVEEVLKKVGHNWRKPDIRADFKDKTVVFEVQLSPIFHHVILERDKDYRAAGKYICWLFDSVASDDPLMRQVDAWGDNNYNIFAFDAAAEEATEASGRLHLTVKYYKYFVSAEHELRAKWVTETVPFSSLTIDRKRTMIYLHDALSEEAQCRQQIRDFEHKHLHHEQAIRQALFAIRTLTEEQCRLLISHVAEIDLEVLQEQAQELLKSISQSSDFELLNRWLAVYCAIRRQKDVNSPVFLKAEKALWKELTQRSRKQGIKIVHISIVDFLQYDGTTDGYYRFMPLLANPLNSDAVRALESPQYRQGNVAEYAALHLLSRYYRQRGTISEKVIKVFYNPSSAKVLISAQKGEPYRLKVANLKQVANIVKKFHPEMALAFLYLIGKNGFVNRIGQDHYSKLKQCLAEHTQYLTADEVDIMLPGQK